MTLNLMAVPAGFERRHRYLRQPMISHPTLRFTDLRHHHDPAAAALMRDRNLIFTYNGRGAIFQLLTALPAGDKKFILVPAFHCPTVVEPLIRAGYQPRFYAITPRLEIDIADLRSRLDENVAAVIVINYFGFPAALSEVRKLSDRFGAILVEDCAHSFLSADPVRLCGQQSDAAIFSFKKLAPTLVGGAIRVNSLPCAVPEPQMNASLGNSLQLLRRAMSEAVDNSDSMPVRWVRSIIGKLRGGWRAAKTMPDSDNTDGEPATFDYPYVDRLARSSLPGLARRVLAAAPLAEYVTRRRRNYELLASILGEIDGMQSVYPELPGDVCPWAYPVLLDNRAQLDIRLHAAGVPLFTFGETLHPAFEDVAQRDVTLYAGARWIVDRILCFSIHQQLDEAQIREYGATINRLLGAHQVAVDTADGRGEGK